MSKTKDSAYNWTVGIFDMVVVEEQEASGSCLIKLDSCRILLKNPFVMKTTKDCPQIGHARKMPHMIFTTLPWLSEFQGT
jgi:hypothetical protein